MASFRSKGSRFRIHFWLRVTRGFFRAYVSLVFRLNGWCSGCTSVGRVVCSETAFMGAYPQALDAFPLKGHHLRAYYTPRVVIFV